MSNEDALSNQRQRWQFWIDVGGTFTDCVARSPSGQLRTHKTLSSGKTKGQIDSVTPFSLFDARRAGEVQDFWQGWKLSVFDESNALVFEGSVKNSNQECLELTAEFPGSVQAGFHYELSGDWEAPLICIRAVLGLASYQSIPDIDVRLGTTRGTNALLERKGARTALLMTRGFRDLLTIGNQDRPDLFDLNITKPEPLYEFVVEIEERLAADGSVLQPLNAADARRKLKELRAGGVESVAIAFLHAYRNGLHEAEVEAIAREIGFQEVSCSSKVAPSIKIVPRGETTVLDAYLTPILRNYIASIRSSLSSESSLKLMTSYGGLVDGSVFTGKDSILSGPAGGVVAFARIGEQLGARQSIGFDMGGTSTDVARYGGEFELQTETTKAGVKIASPTLAIETVAAGGGSICHFDGIQLQVGPESAGADPGPACYGRGGPLTVTDANVVLGRILPSQFPFPLDVRAAHRRIDEIRGSIQAENGQCYSREELAQGFIEIANETMARAIRNVSIRKGYHPQDHLLISFGGAGGQHACAMARQLGMERILIHPFAGILSAYGMGLAEIRKREETAWLEPLEDVVSSRLSLTCAEMKNRLLGQMKREGIVPSQLQPEVLSLELRYIGLESTIRVYGDLDTDFAAQYHREHQRLYGYHHPQRAIELVTVCLELVAQNSADEKITTADASHLNGSENVVSEFGRTKVWHVERYVEARVLSRLHFTPGRTLHGPLVVCDSGSTIWLEPGFVCEVQTDGALLMQHSPVEECEGKTDLKASVSSEPDLIQLEIFNNQFASIAEQMGVTLRKTSVSTNVKERLDYSCAIFDADGGLVVNAPHIPVHLGAMGETVRTLICECENIRPGDVFVTNDPYAGGSHLPDVTVITPVHAEGSGELLFFTASRAHHAEIGGIRPGSMPPFSKSLAEEGVLIRSYKLVDGGDSQEAGLKRLLTSGAHPSRNVENNLADISAQVAANQMGASLLLEMIRAQGLDVVLSYMHHIQVTASRKMRRALSAIPDGEYQRTDYLDNGAVIEVRIKIIGEQAIIDFNGTGPVLKSNLNANRAIVTAACMYVFRSLIDESIPLNSGVLEPLEIILPECLLNPPRHEDPKECAAIVGGNVETSQRVVDVLLGALGKAAASQGTMNNLTFGDDTFGYYETICGGAGATASRAGADAVHTHMTNTRLTDVEVIEHRYPVRIREFAIRSGSGGAGEHYGGNGITRTFEFMKPLQVSLLTQRRGEYAPFGLAGGEPGQIGCNLLKTRHAKKFEEIGGCVQLEVKPGDQLTIHTPGGGGYGQAK